MFVEEIIPLKTKIELSVSVEGLVAPIGVLKSFGSKKTLYINTSLFKKLGVAPPELSVALLISSESSSNFSAVLDNDTKALSSSSVPVLSNDIV